MSEKLPTTTYIIIDRRETGKGKSIPNRQRLLKRIKDAIRSSKPQDLGVGIKKMSAPSGGSANPIKVTRGSLHEPSLHYDGVSGEYDIVFVGNDTWERGDDFPVNSPDDSPGTGGPGDEGEDDFIINVSTDEYLDVFFEDCILPNFKENHNHDMAETVSKPAGFQREGTSGQLHVARSYKNANPRRFAMQTPMRERIEELEKSLAILDSIIAGIKENHDPYGQLEVRARERRDLVAQIETLKVEMEAIPFFEKMDLRYIKREKIAVKAADAVFIMVMDISGSMDEDKKRMARKFFALQYAFIKRKYPQTDLVFVAHTDEAEEMQEKDFFSTRKNGGTMVSPAYEEVHKIIRARYNAQDTNIYLSQASDGDNYDFDNAAVIDELTDKGLLSKLRFMSYAQVGMSFAATYGGTTLWQVIETVASKTNKLGMVKIDADEEVFAAFHKLYRRN